LTAKVQDEVGHSQLIYRIVEDLGKPRAQCLADLISGKAKFHNVFHYPTKTWGDVGVIAWLVDAAAIISQKALLKCSYAPYARIMKKICWEESFHILHGRDVILAMMTGTDEQRALVQEAVDRWWGPLMQFHGNPIPRDEDPMYVWRIKSQGNEEARQQFLDGYVPQIRELGLTVPDPKLRKRDDDGVWEYSEPDWDELKHVVTGHGPKTQERLELRRRMLDQEAWVRSVVLAEAAGRCCFDLGGLPPGEEGRADGARGLRRRGGGRDSEWTGIAPSLEEDVAFSSIAQSEIGHARALYELAARDLGTTADELAFDRSPEDYRCAPLVELRRLDWAHTIARHWLYE